MEHKEQINPLAALENAAEEIKRLVCYLTKVKRIIKTRELLQD